ncbi:MAG: ABC transporter substrate-binding protein [Pirellulaceae bacterium]
MHRNTRRVLLLLTGLVVGCAAPADLEPVLTLATTTSTQDSGVLDLLVPLFMEQTGIKVKVVAVGTGQALALGRRGDADLLLTHAPDAERQFISEGYGTRRREVMYNDFVLVGPAEDPAHITGQTSVVEALRQIAAVKATFVSRGDESGTHLKEKALWRAAAVIPQGDWYLSTGSGMAATLRLASEKRGYAIGDRGTFLAQQENLQLAILIEGDALLHNVYSLIEVNRRKHPHVRHHEAHRFAEFLASPNMQAVIAKFGVDKYGQALFFPIP